MGNRYKLIEDTLLKEADLQIDRAESQGEKAMVKQMLVEIGVRVL